MITLFMICGVVLVGFPKSTCSKGERDLKNWAPVSEHGCWDFQISSFLVLEICSGCKLFLKSLLV